MLLKSVVVCYSEIRRRVLQFYKTDRVIAGFVHARLAGASPANEDDVSHGFGKGSALAK